MPGDQDHNEYWETPEERAKRAALARRNCSDAPLITRVGESNGKAFVVYLRDGTKITVGRDATTKGPAWLIVSQQSKIVAHQNSVVSRNSKTKDKST